MMKLFILSISLLALVSCGDNKEDQQAKVCECKDLYNQAWDAETKAEESGLSFEESQKAREDFEKANADAFDECETFHKELGDEKFHEMGKSCSEKE